MTPYTVTDAEADIRAAIDTGNEAEIRRLEPVVDQLDVHPPPPSILAAALWYAQVGLKVFPLRPGQKIPHPGTHGFEDATTDADVIRAWWDRWPRSNVAVATGHLIDVVDIDGAVGVKSYAGLIDDLPTVYGKVSTPRPGGSHLYVAATPGRGNAAGIFPGIDHRGLGGYVVAPPSVNAEGVAYYWRTPLAVPS